MPVNFFTVHFRRARVSPSGPVHFATRGSPSLVLSDHFIKYMIAFVRGAVWRHDDLAGKYYFSLYFHSRCNNSTCSLPYQEFLTAVLVLE